MENYQKLLSLIILLAFFAALSFYLQKASSVVVCYVEQLHFQSSWQQGVSKLVFSWVIDLIR